MIPTNKAGLVVACMEAEVAFVAMAADARGGPGMRDTIATVPAEYGTSKGWRFNDCRATPGGAIIAGRSAAGLTSRPSMPADVAVDPPHSSSWVEILHCCNGDLGNDSALGLPSLFSSLQVLEGGLPSQAIPQSQSARDVLEQDKPRYAARRLGSEVSLTEGWPCGLGQPRSIVWGERDDPPKWCDRALFLECMYACGG